MNIGQSDAVTIGEYNEQGELMRGYYYSPQNSLGNAPVAIKHNDNGITQTSYYQNEKHPQMLTRPRISSLARAIRRIRRSHTNQYKSAIH